MKSKGDALGDGFCWGVASPGLDLRLVQLHGEAVPEWFAPLGAWDFKSSRLPLWLGHIEPNSDRIKPESDPD